MNPEPIQPEEFARLLSLPEDHPDRRHAEATPQFRARLALLREFESPTASGLPGAELADADRALEARLDEALPALRAHAAAGRGAATSGAQPDSAPRSRRADDAPARARERGGWLSLLRGPAPRLAFAGLAVVAAVSVWSLNRQPAPRPVRDANPAAALQLLAPHASAGALELAWTPVAGADHYRVVFYGADLREVARFDDLVGARLELRADSLPQGLASGENVMAEVTALRAGDAVVVSKARAIRLP